MIQNKIVDCGWGKLILAQTFVREKTLCEALFDELESTRNMVLYAENAHVIQSKYQQDLFIDPSYTYKKKIGTKIDIKYKLSKQLKIREAVLPDDLERINNIYVSQQAIPLPLDFKPEKSIKILVAYETKTKIIVGVCMWIDYVIAFEDPQKGSSLWALAVSPTTTLPGIGLALVNECISRSQKNGNQFLDLSVIHSNHQAISLYEKLGFKRTVDLVLKNKNKINEKLFISSAPDANLNMRSKVIIDGARKRGIAIEVTDEKGFFTLSFGGKSITCYESLTDFTSAISLKYCDNYRLKNIILKKADLSVPEQEEFVSFLQANNFLETHKNIVVKALKGSKYDGTTVDITSSADLNYAIDRAKKHGKRVLLEQNIKGDRFRFLIINFKVVSVLKVLKPFIIGTGKHSIRKLLQKLNRRQSTQFDDMRIPIDRELRSCLREYEYDLDSIPSEGEKIVLRRYANPKNGEFLEPVKLEMIQPEFIEIVEAASVYLRIPVLSVETKIRGAECFIIQVNERPSLGSPHDLKVVDLFLDFLFPQLMPV